jgi:hypothetical protein
MASEHDFKKVMSEHSDDKLIEVLIKRIGYQPTAVEAAIEEAIKRNLIVDENDLEEKYPLVVYNSTIPPDSYTFLSVKIDFQKSLFALYLVGIVTGLFIFFILGSNPLLSIAYIGLVYSCSKYFNKTLANVIFVLAFVQAIALFLFALGEVLRLL